MAGQKVHFSRNCPRNYYKFLCRRKAHVYVLSIELCVLFSFLSECVEFSGYIRF